MSENSTAGGSPIGDLLLGWYGRYIGEPDRRSTIYLGFALFFGGIGLATVGILTFLWSASVGGEPSFVFTLREIAGASGAAGLPLVLLGVTVLLPVDRRAAYAALAGTVVCLGAVVMFTRAYPVDWNVNAARDMSGRVVAVYAVGIAAVIGGTGAALVGHHLERAAAQSAESAESDEESANDVSEEQVEADIERAMADADLSWGGVEKTETKRLQLNVDVDDVDRRNLDGATAKTARTPGSGVDDAVAGLRKLQGRDDNTASGRGTDEQAAALNELRERQRREAEREEELAGVLSRLRKLLP